VLIGRAYDILEDPPTDGAGDLPRATGQSASRKFEGYRGPSKPRSAPATDDKDMRAGAEQTGLLLYAPYGL
jgi:hypothetical protein